MSWKEFEFGDIIEKIKGGGTPSKQNQEYWNGDIFWASVKDMEEGKYKLSSTQDTITQIGLENSSSNLIPKDTLIIATRMGLGRAFINEVDLTINQDLKAIFPKLDIVETKFLLWWYVNNGKYIENLGNGATVKGIRLEHLRAIKINLPPLETQKRIASILSTYDDLIENNLKRINLLEETAQNIYKEWFVNFRFPNYELTEFDTESGLPVGWEIKNLGDIIGFKVDNRGRNPSYYSENGIPVIDNFLLKDSITVDLSFCKRYIDEPIFESFIRNKLEPNDVLITLVGNGAGSISIAPQMKSVIIQNTIGLRCNYLCTQYFLYFYLFNNKSNIQNMNRGAAQPSVKVGDLFNLQIILPKINIINDFSTIIEPVFNMVNTLSLQNQKLKEARDILLPRLMNRTIEV